MIGIMTGTGMYDPSPRALRTLSGRGLARGVPLIAAAVIALLSVSGWTAPSRAGGDTPAFPSRGDVLDGVSAVSPTSAWAVGYYYAKGVSQLSLIEHWNGMAWRQATSPSPGGTGGSTQLDSVSADSAKDAWAVGSDGSGFASHCLTERWNGAKWATVPDPATAKLTHCDLTAVSALSAKDVWAVGSAADEEQVLDRALRRLGHDRADPVPLIERSESEQAGTPRITPGPGFRSVPHWSESTGWRKVCASFAIASAAPPGTSTEPAAPGAAPGTDGRLPGWTGFRTLPAPHHNHVFAAA